MLVLSDSQVCVLHLPPLWKYIALTFEISMFQHRNHKKDYMKYLTQHIIDHRQWKHTSWSSACGADVTCWSAIWAPTIEPMHQLALRHCIEWILCTLRVTCCQESENLDISIHKNSRWRKFENKRTTSGRRPKFVRTIIWVRHLYSGVLCSCTQFRTQHACRTPAYMPKVSHPRRAGSHA